MIALTRSTVVNGLPTQGRWVTSSTALAIARVAHAKCTVVIPHERTR
jgi:hypothetical protein